MGYTNDDIKRVSQQLQTILNVHSRMSYQELKNCLLALFREHLEICYESGHTCRVREGEHGPMFEIVIKRTASEANKKYQLLKGFAFLALRTDLLRMSCGLQSQQAVPALKYGGIRGRFEVEETLFASCLLLSDSDWVCLYELSPSELEGFVQHRQLPRELVAFRLNY